MRANRRDVMAGGMLLAAAGFTKAVQAQQVPAPKSPADTGPQGPQGVPGTSGGGGAGGGLPVINVKADFGAVGDESHDDTAAIQNAVFKALRSKGGTVYFPVGKYKITSSIKFYLTPTSVAKSPNNKMRVAANIAALGLQTGDSAKVYLGKIIYGSGNSRIRIIDSGHFDCEDMNWTNSTVVSVTNNGGKCRIRLASSPYTNLTDISTSMVKLNCPGIPSLNGTTWQTHAPTYDQSNNQQYFDTDANFSGSYTGGGTIEPATNPMTPTADESGVESSIKYPYSTFIALRGEQNSDCAPGSRIVGKPVAGAMFHDAGLGNLWRVHGLVFENQNTGTDSTCIIIRGGSGGTGATNVEICNCTFKAAGPALILLGWFAHVRCCHFWGPGASTGRMIGILGGSISVLQCRFQGLDEAIRLSNLSCLVEACTIEVCRIGVNVGMDINDQPYPVSCSRISNTYCERVNTSIYIRWANNLMIQGWDTHGQEAVDGNSAIPYGVRIEKAYSVTFIGCNIDNRSSIHSSGQVAAVDMSGDTGNRTITFMNCSVATNGTGVKWKLPGPAFDNRSTHRFSGNQTDREPADPPPFLTYAELPAANKVSGDEHVIIDGHSASGAWGETVTGSGGMTIGNCLVRSNGTNWTLIGK